MKLDGKLQSSQGGQEGQISAALVALLSKIAIKKVQRNRHNLTG